MGRVAMLLLLLACGPDVHVSIDANSDAVGAWCPACDRATEYCLIPPVVTVSVATDDGCQPFPVSCNNCDCVLASLAPDTCPNETPQCEVLDDGLVLVSCPGGP